MAELEYSTIYSPALAPPRNPHGQRTPLSPVNETDPPPCPRCLSLVLNGDLWESMLQPLPTGALAPLARDGSGPCCYDCGAADGLMALLRWDDSFKACRVSVGNDRLESYRLPGVRIGLMQTVMRPSQPGHLQIHSAWLEELGFTETGI